MDRSEWEKEFLSGRWDYLDVMPAERARSAIIGMYCRHFSPGEGYWISDVVWVPL